MVRIAKAIVVFVALTAADGNFAGSDSADKYSNYYAARRALDRGDCDAAVRRLDAFLAKYPDVRDKYPDFYLQIRLVVGQCTGTISVRGIEDESSEIDPLPAHPPIDQ